MAGDQFRVVFLVACVITATLFYVALSADKQEQLLSRVVSRERHGEKSDAPEVPAATAAATITEPPAMATNVPEVMVKLKSQHKKRKRVNVTATTDVQPQIVRLRGKGLVMGPEDVPSSDAALTEGKLRIKPEALLKPVGKPEIDTVGAKAKCLRKPKLRLVFCGYVRNRAKLTIEWIQYHRILGVQKFHIYDDDSDDGLFDLLAPFVAAGVVEYHYPPSPPYFFHNTSVDGALLPAFAECAAIEATRDAARGDGEHTWVGFVDPDEFVHLLQDDCLTDLVVETVATNASAIGAVSLRWREVGHFTEDYDDFPTQFHRTRFVSGKTDPIDRIKNIVRADLPESMKTAHFVELSPPYNSYFPTRPPKMVDGKNGWYSGTPRELYDRVMLFHFHARSYSSWLQRNIDGFSDDHAKASKFDSNTLHSIWLWGNQTHETVMSVPERDRFQPTLSLLMEGLGVRVDTP